MVLFFRSILTMRPVVAIEICSGSRANRSAALADIARSKKIALERIRFIRPPLYSGCPPEQNLQSGLQVFTSSTDDRALHPSREISSIHPSGWRQGSCRTESPAGSSREQPTRIFRNYVRGRFSPVQPAWPGQSLYRAFPE